MKKFFYILFLFCLVGCSKGSDLITISPNESKFTTLWREEINKATYQIDRSVDQKKLAFVASNDGEIVHRFVKTILKEDIISTISGSTISADDYQAQSILAVVISDEILSRKTEQIEITLQNDQIMTKPNDHLFGTFFTFLPSEKKSGNTSDENYIKQYRLLDSEGIVIYELSR